MVRLQASKSHFASPIRLMYLAGTGCRYDRGGPGERMYVKLHRFHKQALRTTESFSLNYQSFVQTGMPHEHTCHIFGMAIRIFDQKFCKNPYHSVSLIRSSS